MMLPSVVSAIAATSCLVQMRFPCAYLTRVLKQRVSGDEASCGIIGDRVPAWDLGKACAPRRGLTLLLMNYACSAGCRCLRCRLRHCLGAREAELGVISPHAVEHYPDAPGQGYRRSLLSPPLGNTHCPGGEPVGSPSVQHHRCRLMERGAETCISCPRDLANDIPLTGLRAARR